MHTECERETTAKNVEKMDYLLLSRMAITSMISHNLNAVENHSSVEAGMLRCFEGMLRNQYGNVLNK